MDTQGVQHPRVGSEDGPVPLSHLAAQEVMDLLVATVVPPGCGVLVCRALRRQLVRQESPLTAGPGLDRRDGTVPALPGREHRSINTRCGPSSRLGAACAHPPHRSSKLLVAARQVPASATPSSDTRTTPRLTDRPLRLPVASCTTDLGTRLDAVPAPEDCVACHRTVLAVLTHASSALRVFECRLGGGPEHPVNRDVPAIAVSQCLLQGGDTRTGASLGHDARCVGVAG